VNNIKMDLREIGWDGKDWINLAQDRNQWRALVNTITPKFTKVFIVSHFIFYNITSRCKSTWIYHDSLIFLIW
jgi:hypothetical protein